MQQHDKNNSNNDFFQNFPKFKNWQQPDHAAARLVKIHICTMVHVSGSVLFLKGTLADNHAKLFVLSYLRYCHRQQNLKERILWCPHSRLLLLNQICDERKKSCIWTSLLIIIILKRAMRWNSGCLLGRSRRKVWGAAHRLLLEKRSLLMHT